MTPSRNNQEHDCLNKTRNKRVKVMLLKKTLLISAYKPPIIIANPPYHRKIFFLEKSCDKNTWNFFQL